MQPLEPCRLQSPTVCSSRGHIVCKGVHLTAKQQLRCFGMAAPAGFAAAAVALHFLAHRPRHGRKSPWRARAVCQAFGPGVVDHVNVMERVHPPRTLPHSLPLQLGLGSVVSLLPTDPEAFGYSLERSKLFVEKHSCRPAVVRGFGHEWPSTDLWRFAALVRDFGEAQFLLSRKTFDSPILECELADYASYVRSDGLYHRNPLYVFHEMFNDDPCMEMLDEFESPVIINDLFSFIDEYDDLRPPYRWLLIGTRRSGTFAHQDPHGSAAWNATVTGFKRWVMLPPDISKELVLSTSEEHDTFGWFQNLEPLLAQLSTEQREQCVDFISGPGDIVWVPSEWWHAVINLSPWTVAITENVIPFVECTSPQLCRYLPKTVAENLKQADPALWDSLKQVVEGLVEV